MRLMTTILPRRDGKVILRSRTGKVYEFVAEQAGGDLVCDVDDEDTIATALLTGDFEPVDVEDQERAGSLLMALGGTEGVDGEPESEPGADDDLDDDDVVDPDALPVEANTDPVLAKPAAKPRAKRGT